MASAPSKTTTVRTVNNKTGVTTSSTTHTSAGHTTVTKTTTIGTPKKVAPTAKKATKAPAKLAAAVLGGTWISGPNDTRPLCAPVAVANCLLAATGTEASNAAIERLYRAAGGIGGHAAPILPVLAAARSHGLAGCRLKSFRLAALDDADIVLLDLGGELHAAAFAAMTVITWGGEIPLAELDATIIGAWSLTWHGTESTCGR